MPRTAKSILGTIGHGALIQMLAVAVSSLASLGVTVVVSRRLGYDDLALFAIGFAVAHFASMLSRLGLDLSVVHFTAGHLAGDDLAQAHATGRHALRVGALSGFAMALVVFLAAPLIGHLFGSALLVSVVRIFAIGIPFLNLLHIATAAERGAHRMWAYVFPRFFIYPSLHLVAVAVLLLWQVDTRLAAWGSTLSAIGAGLLATLWVLRSLPAGGVMGGRGEVFRFAGWNWASQNLQVVLVWADLFILGYFATTTVTGTFRVALQVAQLLVLVELAIEGLFVPAASRLLRTGRVAELVGTTQSAGRVVFALTSTAGAFFILFPQGLVLLFGGNVASSFPALVILCLGFSVASILGPGAWLLIQGGYTRLDTGANLIAAVFAIVAGFALVPEHGASGAAAAVTGALVARLLVHLFLLHVKFGYTPLSNRAVLGLGVFSLVITVSVMARLHTAAWGPAAALVALAAVVISSLFIVLAPGDRAWIRESLHHLVRPRGAPPESPDPAAGD